MADSDGIAPHQHQWMVWTGPDGKLEVLANSSCPTCGLTPEAVANAAAVKTLLAEVERLCVREAATMEIVRAVAQVVWSSYCPWCHLHGTMREVEHYDDCPVLAARTLTGITPADEDE